MNKPSSVVVLEARNIVKRYVDDASEPAVLNQLNLILKAGETVAIIGTSGAGKSTLLHVLGGLDKPNSGAVFWNDKPIAQLSEKALGIERNQQLGFVYQFHHLLPEFSTLDNVAMPLRIRGLSIKDAREQAEAICTRVGLGHRLKHLPSELSGGERQRVAISRALVTRPKVLLADEPTGNLDADTAAIVFEEMMALNRETGAALLLVTHSLDLAKQCEITLQLKNGILARIDTHSTFSA
jgi:lipoprotein-releasing system ATP-binding protein